VKQKGNYAVSMKKRGEKVTPGPVEKKGTKYRMLRSKSPKRGEGEKRKHLPVKREERDENIEPWGRKKCPTPSVAGRVQPRCKTPAGKKEKKGAGRPVESGKKKVKRVNQKNLRPGVKKETEKACISIHVSGRKNLAGKKKKGSAAGQGRKGLAFSRRKGFRTTKGVQGGKKKKPGILVFEGGGGEGGVSPGVKREPPPLPDFKTRPRTGKKKKWDTPNDRGKRKGEKEPRAALGGKNAQRKKKTPSSVT